MIKQYSESYWHPDDNPLHQKPKPTGGPAPYYDFPFQDWVTTNDMMEHLAEHKWGKFGIHLKDIFKGLCRWGEKDGTTVEYDSRKIIYYGVRVYKMLVGVEKTRAYLQELLDDKQFGGDK
jgi:hypothetical protein